MHCPSAMKNAWDRVTESLAREDPRNYRRLHGSADAERTPRMPILSPADALKLTQHDENELLRAETRINDAIRQWTGDAKLYVGYSPATRIMRELRRRCEESGWSLEVECDQRDGSFLVLTPTVKF